jgi:hypothetical protein
VWTTAMADWRLRCVPEDEESVDRVVLKKRNLFKVKLGKKGPQNHFWTLVATVAA